MSFKDVENVCCLNNCTPFCNENILQNYLFKFFHPCENIKKNTKILSELFHSIVFFSYVFAIHKLLFADLTDNFISINVMLLDV